METPNSSANSSNQHRSLSSCCDRRMVNLGAALPNRSAGSSCTRANPSRSACRLPSRWGPYLTRRSGSGADWRSRPFQSNSALAEPPPRPRRGPPHQSLPRALHPWPGSLVCMGFHDWLGELTTINGVVFSVATGSSFTNAACLYHLP